MTEREKFEAWFADFQGQTIEWVRYQRLGDSYPIGWSVRSYWEAWQAAISSQQPKVDVWIEWHGGECPVSEFALIDIKFRSGRVVESDLAGHYEWAHGYYHYIPITSADIIAYRILKP